LIGDNGRQTNYFTYLAPPGADDPVRPSKVTFSAKVESPYRGLIAFGMQDAAFFFGREAAADEILRRLSGQPFAPALLVVSGVSGAGKSSLLQAGVVPRIAEITPGGAPWPHLVLTPARAPLTELADHMAPLVSADAASLRQALRADPSGFALTALEAASAQPSEGGRGRLLLVVDQFEQVFTQCTDDSERHGFITALHAAATTGHGPAQVPAAMVILVVRADFEARCADYQELADAVQHRYLLPRMTEPQLRLAITEPARVAGSAVDDALVGELVRAVRAVPSPDTSEPVAGTAGVLPHLSHALDQAWRNRVGDVLTLADYTRTGGVEGSIAASADRAYASLTASQREAARQVFIRLIATSADGTDTADRASRAELTEGKSLAGVADVEAVLEAFAAERLLTLAADSVELSHEVLLTAWPTLRGWLAETHANRRGRSQLRRAAADWTSHNHDPSYLYRGSVLDTMDGIAARVRADPARNPPLGQPERDFLQASNSARHRARRRWQAVIAGLAALTLVATAIAVIAFNNARTAAHNADIAARNAGIATQQRAIALSRQLAAESLTTDPTDPFTARQLAVAAWGVYPTTQAGSAMTTLLAEQLQAGALLVGGPDQSVNGVAFSPDGKLLATADADGTVQLWNPATRQPVGAALPAASGDRVNGVTFSPDGKLLATADADGAVQLWNLATRQPVGTPISPVSRSTADGVAFSPDGRLLAIAESDGTVRLWNVAADQPIGTLVPTDPRGVVFGVAFSPDGKLLATADVDGAVQLWNPATRQPVGTALPADPRGSTVFGVAFSPDGKLLATADVDGAVQLWNPATRQPVGTPISPVSRSSADGVAFSPDGRLLAIAESDGTVRLWNVAADQPVGTALPADPRGAVFGVVFSPDGKLVATAGTDGTVRLWSTATGQPVGTPLPAGAYGRENEMAFSADGRLLATAESNGTVRLWNTATGQPVGIPIPTDLHSTVFEMAFSPDGELLATASLSGTVRLWNTATGQPVGTPFSTGTGPNPGVSGVAFSPDGKLLATAGIDGTVRLWNTATSQAVGASIPAPPLGTVNGVAFSPDGKLLAIADSNGTVRLWNPVTDQAVRTPIPADPGGAVEGVAFSPDGTLLATADNNGTVGLWSTATGQPVGAPIPADPGGAVEGVAFSPDGTLLATADSTGTVQLWWVSLFTNPYEALCADVGPPTQQEWDMYAPDEPFPKVCA
jgi:WD40 repeat protein